MHDFEHKGLNDFTVGFIVKTGSCPLQELLHWQLKEQLLKYMKEVPAGTARSGSGMWRKGHVDKDRTDHCNYHALGFFDCMRQERRDGGDTCQHPSGTRQEL